MDAYSLDTLDGLEGFFLLKEFMKNYKIIRYKNQMLIFDYFILIIQ